ncbi:DUF4823 domain-containing protein [Simiduia curdlanivorans]|uniref:DUF4823 domain-containing protein n=1 Tax=Simiduia curdlanivorans TaxID=1492769 RepID=A0ABV8V7V8_9GAMM|nr:DUF4823 domain-containing protein [Simiduia curdlanivorans]MDN3639676.1 DUF4823 domain-containing protein [Simiduia curdlanivorans]
MNKSLQTFLSVGLLNFCVGCTFNHTLTNTQAVLTDLQLVSRPQMHGGRDWVVPRQSHWLVAVSASAPDAETDHQMSRALAAALRQEFAVVSLTTERLDVQAALKNARSNGANFMVYPKYLYRGDGAFSVDEWQAAKPDQSFGRDRVGVQLVVYDVISARMIDSVNITNKESWLPSISAEPDVLFNESFEKFAQGYAYQRTERPK